MLLRPGEIAFKPSSFRKIINNHAPSFLPSQREELLNFVENILSNHSFNINIRVCYEIFYYITCEIPFIL